MKIVRKCLNCGKEYESTDRKNASLYCGKECKDSHVANNVKEMFESVTEGLGQAVDMEELKNKKEELLGMVVTKQKEKSDGLWQAVRLLHNQKANIQDLINQSESNMKAEEVRLSDIQHKMFLLDLTESELLRLAIEQREILSRRSAYKNLLNCYKLISHIEFEPEISQALNYGKSYKLKTEEGSFSFGDIYSEFLEKQQQLVEEETKKAEEKEALSIQNEEVLAFAEELNSVPIKGRMITTISFQKHSLADLKAKHAQLEPRCKAMRVDVSKGTITTYN